MNEPVQYTDIEQVETIKFNVISALVNIANEGVFRLYIDPCSSWDTTGTLERKGKPTLTVNRGLVVNPDNTFTHPVTLVLMELYRLILEEEQ